MSKTILKNPTELKKHELRKLLPEPSKQRVDAISDAIQRKVKLPPIYIVEPNLVVAGWTRTLAHRARQQDIECIVITEDEVTAVAFGENTNRQSYQYKYQVAWVYCPLAIKVVEESNARKISNLKATPKAQESNNRLLGNLPATLDDVADLIGISRPLLLQVKGCYDAILEWDNQNEPRCWNGEKKKRTAMDYWSSKILDEEDPCTPGNAKAGLAGSDAAEQDKTKPTPKVLENFVAGFAALKKWGKSYNKFDEGQRKKAVDAIKTTLAAWPAELREEILAEIRKINKEAKEAE